MAKAKTKTRAKKKIGKTLTVEFAGICTLIRAEDNPTLAQVLLVDVENALNAAGEKGSESKHSAVLAIAVGEEQTERFDADQTVSVPGDLREYAIWDLAGATVSFEPGTRRGVTVSNLKYLAPLNEACRTDGKALSSLDEQFVSAAVNIEHGRIAPVKVDKNLRYKFMVDREQVVEARPYAPRFKLTIPFRRNIQINIKFKNGKPPVTLKFKKDASLLIGNLCHSVGRHRDHFPAHYAVLDTQRRPRIKGVRRKRTNSNKAPGEFWPVWDYCAPAIAFLISAASMMGIQKPTQTAEPLKQPAAIVQTFEK